MEQQRTWSLYGVNTKVIEDASHVSNINLGNNNLTGSIPVELVDFAELTYLGLWGY